MLPTDNAEAASKTAQMVQDPRVRQFHDPRGKKLAGKAFAKDLIEKNRGPAWDIYMFHKKGDEWKTKPPLPVEYMHQLSGGERADPKYFITGEDLVNQLHETMHRVTGEECKP